MPVEVTWSRSGRRPFTSRTSLEDSGVIKFTNVSMEEAGTYICIARNVVGYREFPTLLTVTETPKITVRPSTEVNIRSGSSITLHCNADGTPTPHVAWQKVDPIRGSRTITRYRRQSVTITVRADEIQTSTQYICIARNTGGASRETVTVTAPPQVTIERATVSVPIGQQVKLSCDASGRPSPRVQWSKYQDQLPAESIQTGGVLTINRANSGSAGIYICEAVNSAGRDTGRSTLHVIVPPKISLQPSKGIVQIASGRSQVITCLSTEGSEPIKYTFRKVHGDLPSNIHSSGNQLSITNFSPATDSGTYACIASNSAGTSTAEVTILPLESPNVQVSLSEVTAIAGDLIEVRCVASGGAGKAWTRVGSDLDRTRSSVTNGVLRIKNSQISDAGEYKCTASNDAGYSEKSVYVLVQELPKVSISLSTNPEELRVGAYLEILCNTSGHPIPTVTMTKNGQEVLNFDDSKLVIEALSQDDTGTYACVAQNTAGNAQDEVDVAIKAPLMISIIPDTDVIETMSGDDLAISCVVKGTDLDVMWTRKDGRLPETALILDGSLLQIDSVSTEDAGEYVCTADSNGQRVWQSVNVIVHAFVPFFSQSPRSYMAISPTPDLYGDFTITVSFRPSYEEGLILYSGSTVGDYVSVLLRNGKVEFRYNVGSGDAVIQSDSKIDLAKWHTITIKRDGREGSMVVNDEEPKYGRSEGSFQGLDVHGPLYVGGISESQSTLPTPLQFLGKDAGLYGCISQISINGKTIDLGSSEIVIEKVGVLTCRTCGGGGESSPCQHESQCTESHFGKKGYVCSCTDEYVGPECQFRKEDICGDIGVCGQHGSCIPDYSQNLGYRCDCVHGYIGTKCQFLGQETSEAEPQAIPEATSFSKGSYMALDVTHDDVTTFSTQLKVKLRSLDDGLILYNGAELNRRKKRSIALTDIFISIAILNGTLEFRYSCGTGVGVLRSNRPVFQVNQWHVIRAQRQNRQGILQVDGEVVAQGQSPTGSRRANLERSLYVGGVKYWDQIFDQTGVSVGMDGCIDEVYVNRNKKSLHANTGSKNVEGCDPGQVSTPSTAAALQRDPADLHLDSRDSSEITGKLAKFNGNSYISFPQEVFPHDTGVEQISLHFKTRDSDGLLFMQGQSGRDYILLGLRNSRLEYAFHLGSSHRTAEESFPLSDGHWHNITVLRRQSFALLWVDDLQIPVAVQASVAPPEHSVLGDLFIGGAEDVAMYTGDRYRKGFRGCIKNVKVASLTEAQSKLIGATYFDVSAIPSLQFGPGQGRKTIKGVTKCRGDKSRTSELQIRRL